jgi:hypothetical protein
MNAFSAAQRRRGAYARRSQGAEGDRPQAADVRPSSWSAWSQIQKCTLVHHNMFARRAPSGGIRDPLHVMWLHRKPNMRRARWRAWKLLCRGCNCVQDPPRNSQMVSVRSVQALVAGPHAPKSVGCSALSNSPPHQVVIRAPLSCSSLYKIPSPSRRMTLV